jgi:hypothetical protein
MRAYVFLGICGLSLGWSSLARAASPSLESRARAAQRACLTGNPAKGVELLTDLYLDTQDPTYIYNQGRCFEMNRRYEDAIGRFREYMVKAKKLPEAEKAETEKRIAACQSYLAKPEPSRVAPKTEPSPAPGTKPEPPLAAPAQPTPASTPGTAVGETGQMTAPTPFTTIEQRPADKPGSPLRIAGLVTGAVGVGGLVAGVILNLKVNSMSSDLEKQYNYRPATDATRENYKTAGWIAYGAGATCLVGGALLYYFGWRRGSTEFAPAVAPGMAGAAVKGVF